MAALAPRILKHETVDVSGRLQPPLKDTQIRALPERTDRLVAIIGNSTQFNLSKANLEAGFNCAIGSYFNFSVIAAEAYVNATLIEHYAARFRRGDTVLWAVYPNLFKLDHRRSAVTGSLPWRDLAMWWRDIRDGNVSFYGLYPEIVHLEWPQSLRQVFPLAAHIRARLNPQEPSSINMTLRPDGSVLFKTQEAVRRRRLAANVTLDLANIRRIAERASSSPYVDWMFGAFDRAAGLLAGRGVRIYAYEPIFHPVYRAPLDANRAARARFLSFMRGQAAKHAGFVFVESPKLAENLVDSYWIDETHVADEFGALIAGRLATAIPAAEICRP